MVIEAKKKFYFIRLWMKFFNLLTNLIYHLINFIIKIIKKSQYRAND